MPAPLRPLTRALLTAAALAAAAGSTFALDHSAIGIAKWGLPAVRCDRVYQAVLSTDASFNQIVYWSRLPDWKNQLIAPDPEAIYVLPFLNTTAVGPLVLEIPPMEEGTVNGTLFDCGLRDVNDVRSPTANIDASGRYLVLPPDYADTPPDGYVPIRSRTYQDYVVLRLLPKSTRERDVADAVMRARQIKLYPLSQATHPPSTKFIDASHMEFDATIPYDLRFFQSLDRIVQTEPWLSGGNEMADRLRSIGIQRGRAFLPDQDSQSTLAATARDVRAQLATRNGMVFTNYYDRGQWAVWERDEGRFGLLTFGDADGQLLDGGNHYRLRVPASVPAAQYWSATVYDTATHAFIRNLPWPGRSSQSPELQTNGDGSVDLYFGPTAPDGKGSNWIPTTAYGTFEVVFRFHGPATSVFDKTWQLPDIEPVK